MIRAKFQSTRPPREIDNKGRSAQRERDEQGDVGTWLARRAHREMQCDGRRSECSNERRASHAGRKERPGNSHQPGRVDPRRGLRPCTVNGDSPAFAGFPVSAMTLLQAVPIDRDSLRLRSEFLELPGLSVTVPQAARLFGVRLERAAQMLELLEHEGFLHRDARGTYRRG